MSQKPPERTKGIWIASAMFQNLMPIPVPRLSISRVPGERCLENVLCKGGAADDEILAKLHAQGICRKLRSNWDTHVK